MEACRCLFNALFQSASVRDGFLADGGVFVTHLAERIYTTTLQFFNPSVQMPIFGEFQPVQLLDLLHLDLIITFILTSLCKEEARVCVRVNFSRGKIIERQKRMHKLDIFNKAILFQIKPKLQCKTLFTSSGCKQLGKCNTLQTSNIFIVCARRSNAHLRRRCSRISCASCRARRCAARRGDCTIKSASRVHKRGAKGKRGGGGQLKATAAAKTWRASGRFQVLFNIYCHSIDPEYAAAKDCVGQCSLIIRSPILPSSLKQHAVNALTPLTSFVHELCPTIAQSGGGGGVQVFPPIRARNFETLEPFVSNLQATTDEESGVMPTAAAAVVTADAAPIVYENHDVSFVDALLTLLDIRMHEVSICHPTARL